jgi:DNA-binding CsgD family transcriptional regulator
MERSDHRRRIEAARGHAESDDVLRLRRRRDTTGAAETVADAPGPARSPGGRESLRAAAVATDRAGARSRDAAGRLDLHQALVAGCWSLVDSFERDGKRYLIARPGAPGSVSGLSVRESQVVLFVAMGHALKRIAYELGISQSSVATYLRRGLVKLQLPDRIALTRRFTGFREQLPDAGDHDDTGA